MGPALNLIDDIVAMVKEVNEMEAKNEGINILPYLMGTNESDLVWRNNETSELWIKDPKMVWSSLACSQSCSTGR